MESDLAFDGLDFEGRGYFGCPESPSEGMLASPHRDAWVDWLQTFRAASTRGDFTGIAALASMQKAITDPVWRGAAGDLIGDSGPDSVLAKILAEAASEATPDGNLDDALHLCRELRAWGRLDTVPILLRVWEAFLASRDAVIIPIFISDLIEYDTGPLSDPSVFPSAGTYREAVMARYQDRATKFGTTQVFVLQGARFGVNRLAERIIWQVHEAQFPVSLRRSFEASTGIECTDFYENGVERAMPIKRKMEAFLDSPATELYEDGKRYFFGRPLA
jgi:hypothetical protein